MRYQDIRRTVYKRTTASDLESASDVATRLRLSPFLADGVSIRESVNARDILRPMRNRRSRRANGMTRPRRRVGGVALTHKPWHQETKESAA